MRRVDVCPACGCTDYQVVARANEDSLARYYAYSACKYGGLLNDWLSDTQLAIARCDTCGHCWYRDQPEKSQLDAMYAAGVPLKGGAPSRKPTPDMLAEMRRLRRLVQPGMARLLDYGSGFGRWARAGVEAGFDVCAFEPSMPRGGENEPPFTLIHSIDELHGEVFDIVNLEQVLEHVPDPVHLLTGIREYCHSGSLIRITVPNIMRSEEGAAIWHEWPFDGRRAHVMAPFEHLHGFTPQSLRETVRQAKFEPIKVSRLLAYNPILAVRAYLGRLIPSLGTTCLIIQPLKP